MSESFQFTHVEDDVECSNSTRISDESDSSQKTGPVQAYRKAVPMENPNLTSVSSLKDSVSPAIEVSNKNGNVTMRSLKSPTSGARLPSNSKILRDSQRVEDYSMLENKINDSLLDLLQGKIVENLPKAVESYRTEEKQDESLKLITIFPTENIEKIIHLIVKGRTCRSKKPLNATEKRIVSQIVKQETMFGRRSGSYKNVYYDPESDTNIRYEVRRIIPPELGSSPGTMLYVQKKAKMNPGSLIREGRVKRGSDEGKLVRNKVARTRFGRIFRPPRHVMRDYKRLKYLSELNEADENENTGGYSDYDIEEDLDASDDNTGWESEKRDLYGPLEPSKEQCSSLSICPTCNKVYLGYRRMAVHFQKYPDHKDEELLQQLLEKRKKEINYNNGLCDERLTNMRNTDCRNCNSSQKNAFNKKSKLNSKLMAQRLRSPAVYIKELLSCFGAKEIAKYAGPIVAEALNSWEYLLLRSEKLKTGDGTLLISLLKELKVILAQVQAMSSHVLEPLTKENQFSGHKLTIGPKDVLQHVLGVSSGTYVISDSKPLLSAPPPSQELTVSLSQINPPKPQNIIQSTDSTTAKLFDDVVAECLRDDSLHMDSNSAEPSQKIDSNCQNVTLVVYNDPVGGSEAVSINKVPIFTSKDLPVSTQIVVPQAVQPLNDDVNPPLVLDFDIFNQTASNDLQLSTNAAIPKCASQFENDSRARNKPRINNVAPSLPSLTDNIAFIDDSTKQIVETNDILDFSFLE